MEKEAMIMGLSSEWPQTSQDVKVEDIRDPHTPQEKTYLKKILLKCIITQTQNPERCGVKLETH